MLFHGKFEIYDDRKFLIYSVKMSSYSVNDLRRFFEDINSNFNRKSGKTEIFILWKKCSDFCKSANVSNEEHF